MVTFAALWLLFVCQRMAELGFAARNARWLKKRGGHACADPAYPWIAGLHAAFFASLAGECIAFRRWQEPPWWPALIGELAAQVLRAWSMASLGRRWHVRLYVLPGAPRIARGPYRWLRHPNYVAVAADLLFIPLIFREYVTAIAFSIANALVLSRRIRDEEAALAANDGQGRGGSEPPLPARGQTGE